MKKLMLGNEAVARGLYEAGVSFVSSYPGTPSTEITEYAAKYNEIYAEWAPNEKVAAEAAFGAAVAGARAFSGMKHVGLNVAADLLFTAAYTGINGGYVIAVADDMGLHSSQNEQDSRHYAISSKVMMLEPSDSDECLRFTKLAFELSEKYDTLVLLRLSTRVSHSQGIVELSDRQEVGLKPYVKNIDKFVMMPAKAKLRHKVVEERQAQIALDAENMEINKTIMGDTKIGIISAGIAFEYAYEALSDKASYLKLGIVNPLPVKLIKDFAKKVDKLYVIEELDPIIENHCKVNGIDVKGKEIFSLLYEYTPEEIREKILGEQAHQKSDIQAPIRPPIMCPGCPHRGLFHIFKELNLIVSGDIGCYTLGATPPLNAMDTTICMGASVSMLHGITKANPALANKTVGVIGDSTFMHSGITGLIDIVYNNSPSTLIIADNSITGMTGHQQNPTTGITLKQEKTTAIDIEAVCRAVGVQKLDVVDPHDIKKLKELIEEHLACDCPTVIITKRPCVLLKHVKKQAPLSVTPEKCKKCRACMKIGCPAISYKKESGAAIDFSLCVGCELCKKLCVFDAIK